jgi:hypothetical protein
MPTDVHEPIDVSGKSETTGLALRDPGVPVSLNELAALKGEAIEIIEARVQVLETLRKAAIRATSPEDWLLFKSPDEQGGQVVGYLQDCGADRVRDLYGIEIFEVSRPERIGGNDPKIFHYLIEGSGRCKLTRQILERVEGGRSSMDDFCRGKSGADLELAVRKAARANLDGNITRELAGMKSVPAKELEAAWAGTSKSVQNCRLGRGFGTAGERLGANKETAPDVPPPICKVCGTPGKYREGKNGRGAFYGCPNYTKHHDQKWTVDAEKWVADQKKAAAPSASTAPAAAGARREPGEEG